MIYDQTIERSVIGGLLQTGDPRKWIPGLTERDFTVPEYKAIFAAMKKATARREPYDAPSIGRAIAEEFPTTGQAAVLEALRYSPSTVMLPQDIKALREITTRRDMERIAAMDSLRKLTSGNDGWVEMTDLVMTTIDEIETASQGKITYLNTGVPHLDTVLGGLFPGEMTVLGARPAVGKSALAAYMAMHIAGAGKKVGVCSLEMTPSQYLRRLIAARSGVEGRKLRIGKGLEVDDWEHIMEAANELANLNMPFTFSVRTVEALRAEAERRKDERGLDLLVVDYLQLLKTAQKTDSEFVRITTVSHELKAMALDLKIPVLALAQVSRPQQKGRLEMPTMDCLRGSGDIEQDADSVVFLHRPETLDDPAIPECHRGIAEMATRNGNQYIALQVAKNRNDSLGRIGLIFDPSHMTYKCIAKG